MNRMDQNGANYPIFIVGMARSGTTLLRSILNSHPNIAIPRETTFFYLIEKYIKANRVSSFSKEEVDRFWNWYSMQRKFTYLGLEEKKVKENFVHFNDYKNFKAVLDAVMITNLENNNKKRWGEKTPGHEEYLDKILELYPNSKVLFMIRDPRSVYNSLKNVPWNNQFLSVIIKRWNKSVAKYLEYEDNKNVYLITYEELVINTKKAIIEICEFIGEEFTERMITHRVNDVPDKTDSSWTTLYETSVVDTDIDNRSLLKWKKQLTGFDISFIESNSNQRIFNRFYKRSGKKLSLLDQFKYTYLKVKYYSKKIFNNAK